MSASTASVSRPMVAPLLVLGGLVLLVVAWTVPVNLKSVSPAQLRAAGADTPSLAAFGRQLVQRLSTAESSR